MKQESQLSDSGVNAIWIGERGIRKDRVAALKAQGAKVFAEFNTLHRADYLKKDWTFSALSVEWMLVTCRAQLRWIRSVRRTLADVSSARS